MYNLTENDLKILRFIEKHETADIESIKKEFPDMSAIEYRLEQLSTPEYQNRAARPNSCCLKEHVKISRSESGYADTEYLGIYELTELGKRELQDHLAESQTRRKELWLKNAWIPIIVAFVTTVGTNYILPKLLRILQWAASILSRIAS